ncbi:tRNA uridine-5-carboxymethylaminomethyl(34) synthesis enzyme MnmG [bacterium]|nr:tRNA uridine-5-carboxymethylaminomethyl(34) synthesis enzyme MnmG [bacterium]
MSDFDIIVIGGGHAGCEAASAAARMGCKTALVTFDKTELGRMSCNPAMGGIAKGQLVKEIDALGGEMGYISDSAAVQFRILGRSKGPAAWSPRAQVDRNLYENLMSQRMSQIEGLEIIEGEAAEILVKSGSTCGVKLKDGAVITGKAVILSAGTFLQGYIHTGKIGRASGRWDEKASIGLSRQLEYLGFEIIRLKTGTPPRLLAESINYSKMEPQAGDEDPYYFSRRTKNSDITGRQLLCHKTYTNNRTHQILHQNLDRAPLYDGTIKGIGPRYCPSIETKIVKFPEREKHLLFVEPEGWDHPWIYLNGFSTSMPVEVQEEALNTIEGLEEAVMLRPGYAIEYDAFPPNQVKYTLETRLIENLYFAGQIIGTSGYEEAGGLGLMAAINAVLKLKGEPPFILDRSQAYIGVMIDDLITKGAPEPYRMFTSRAEYRLTLRSDNADKRLGEFGRKFGLLNDDIYKEIKNKYLKIDDVLNRLKSIKISLEEGTYSALELLRRPEIELREQIKTIPALNDLMNEDREVLEGAEIAVKYEGYINRQTADVERFRRMERKRIPAGFDFDSVPALSREGRENLKRVNPPSLGAASRLYGVTPADTAVLAVYLKRGDVPCGTFHDRLSI